MRLTIDNLDGLGAVDYSAAIDTSEALAIQRTLNAPSIAKGLLCLEGTSLAVPARRGRVILTSAAGVVLFTGYLTTEPVPVYAGVASEGSVYRLAFSAVSDEWLLDKQTGGALLGSASGSPAGTALTAIATRAGAGTLTSTGATDSRAVGVLESQADLAWSGQAGLLSNASYSAYRVLNGALQMTQAGSVVHAFSDGDGSLSLAELKTASVRELANDVTLSGAMEPSVYWTEVFLGDGTTTVFDLQGEPDAPGAGHGTLVADPFTGTSFDLQRWEINDPGSHLSVGGGTSGAGLSMTGGNGVDGGTVLQAWDTLEVGGTLVAQMSGVVLAAASAGVVCGMYQGSVLQANCFAGFNVRQAGGQTVLTPMVNGVEMGTTFTLISGHSYTLRLRMHCVEMLRVRQNYYAMVDVSGGGQVQAFGGGLVSAPAALVFEIRDEGSSSNTPITVLYDGTVASSPALVTFVAINSVQLFGSIGNVLLTRTGSAWVRSLNATTGTPFTRLIGKASQGADCSVTSSATGKVTFFPGRAPAVGEYVTVSYRGRRRAVARFADAASLAAEAAGGGVGTARWLGKTVSPMARCTADCESAAQAVLSFSTNRAAATRGRYTAIHAAGGGDIWPGDVLALTTNGDLVNVVVRSVEVQEQGTSPEALTYGIVFANDWAEGLGLKLSEAIAADALLPQTALELASGASAPVLANLQQLTFVASATALTVDAGMTPPAGGGFEVRRRDGGFGAAGTSSASGDLVLRSPVRGFTIPRAVVQEAFFVRMYDASTPPLYSRESTAIYTDLPIS